MKSLWINKNKTGRVGKKVREIKTDCNITLGVYNMVFVILFQMDIYELMIIASNKMSLPS